MLAYRPPDVILRITPDIVFGTIAGTGTNKTWTRITRSLVAHSPDCIPHGRCFACHLRKILSHVVGTFR